MVVDRFGDVHSLSRYVKGVPAKEIKARLAPIAAAGLPSVDQAREQVQAQHAAQQERVREQAAQHEQTAEKAEAKHDAGQDQAKDMADDGAAESGGDDAARQSRSIDQKRAAMDARQRDRRLEFGQAEQVVLTRHQDEKLALDAAQKAESGGLLFRMRARVADLIAQRPALRSVLGHITEKTGLDPRERRRLEQQALARRHARERMALAGRKRAMEKIEHREKVSLERDLKREALRRMLREEQMRAAMRAEGLAADEERAALRTDPRLLEEGAFQDEFNREAAGDHHYDDDPHGGDDDAGRKPRKSWKQRREEKGLSRGRGKGGGYGYGRGE